MGRPYSVRCLLEFGRVVFDLLVVEGGRKADVAPVPAHLRVAHYGCFIVLQDYQIRFPELAIRGSNVRLHSYCPALGPAVVRYPIDYMVVSVYTLIMRYRASLQDMAYGLKCWTATSALTLALWIPWLAPHRQVVST